MTKLYVRFTFIALFLSFSLFSMSGKTACLDEALRDLDDIAVAAPVVASRGDVSTASHVLGQEDATSAVSSGRSWFSLRSPLVRGVVLALTFLTPPIWVAQQVVVSSDASHISFFEQFTTKSIAKYEAEMPGNLEKQFEAALGVHQPVVSPDASPISLYEQFAGTVEGFKPLSEESLLKIELILKYGAAIPCYGCFTPPSENSRP